MLVDVENFKSQQVGWDDVLRQMDTIQSSTRQVLTNLRQLLHDLRGEELVEDGFINSLTTLISQFQEKTRIKVLLEVIPGWPVALTAPASVNLYRIVEEALANVRMHSGAQIVSIVLQPLSEGEVALVVVDDGRGVDTDPSRPTGLGMVGMRERAILLGGKLQIESLDGSGTRVQAAFPRAHLIPHEQVQMSADMIPSALSA
jgi:signal transduction histidine kinase